MNGLEAEFDEQIQFVRLEAGQPENARIQQAYGLRGHPSVAILDRNGQVAHRYFGPESADVLRETLSELVP